MVDSVSNNFRKKNFKDDKTRNLSSYFSEAMKRTTCFVSNVVA